jgi:hypothetical protein
MSTALSEREKYQRYLCSREWAEKRRAVMERAKDTCERCLNARADAVHHLTYARKYAERLDDLQAICDPCHQFLHGKSDRDPLRSAPPMLGAEPGLPVKGAYLAGRITGTTWRDLILSGWSKERGSASGACGDRKWEPIPLRGPQGRPFAYTGPFWRPMGLCCGHGSTADDAAGLHLSGAFHEHGSLVTSHCSDIASEIRGAIEASDLVFAWLDSREAYGTLAEIGYAAGFGRGRRNRRPFVVAAMPEFDRELWLALHLADARILAPDPVAAWRIVWTSSLWDHVSQATTVSEDIPANLHVCPSDDDLGPNTLGPPADEVPF